MLGTSFGGFVAQAYASRHPGHAGKLILITTAAKVDFPAIYDAFDRLGGPAARQAAEAYWSAPSEQTRAIYRDICVPLYTACYRGPADWMHRMISRNDTGVRFNGPSNEHGRFDFRGALAKVPCPVLVMGGEADPITPIALSEIIAASLPASNIRFARFPECGHGIVADDPDGAFQMIRDFILS